MKKAIMHYLIRDDTDNFKIACNSKTFCGYSATGNILEVTCKRCARTRRYKCLKIK